MSKYIVLKEKESVHGCCNMVVWDLFISWLIVGLFASQYLHLHTAICIIIGLVTSVTLIFLMNIKYIGPILQIAISIFWTVHFWTMLKDFEWFQHNVVEDTIWNWTVKIGMALLFIGLHVASFNDLRDGEDAYSFSLPFNKNIPSGEYVNTVEKESISIAQQLKNSHMEILNDVARLKAEIQALKVTMEDLETCNQTLDQIGMKSSEFVANFNILGENISQATMTSVFDRCNEILIDLKILKNKFSMQYETLKQKPYQNESYKKSYNYNSDTYTNNSFSQNTDQSSYFDPTLFAGCNSKESLTKRYKNLMKTFHPDNADGDTEMTQKIKETYEELLKEGRYDHY